jgi:hypothetical protein
MTQKSEFDAEEWSRVSEAPPLAGVIVVTAQRGGTLRESIALGKAYAEARQNQGSNEILDAIVAEQPHVNPQERYGSAEELRTAGLEKIREAIELLSSKATPDEVDGYKQFIVDLAERAAHAHKEGGFLGIGGKEVSDAEQQALDEIRAAVDSPDQQHASPG